jgi:hypothetical protein
MTPLSLAEAIVNHFKPYGKTLEPCKGSGSFFKFLPNADWCEITEGRDFLNYDGKVEFIITNPPWSKIRPFLNKAMQVANNVIFLMTINHVWTKARLRDVKENNFGIKEIHLCPTPKSFPQMGFQLGAIHFQRNWLSSIILSETTWIE